jgi:indolepyruvate ferredoxin oxidoreductase beta subunit
MTDKSLSVEKDEVLNILMAGVGGQGLILAARVLGDAAIAVNSHCITSEVHGMARRGGMVTCLVRLGDVNGPLMATGAADVLLGFEPLEALRAQRMTSRDTVILLNTNKIIPFTVSSGQDEYPALDQIISAFKDITDKVHPIDVNELAEQAGAPQALNIVLLGALAKTGLLPFDKDVLIDSVAKNVPARFKDANMRAVELGYDTL